MISIIVPVYNEESTIENLLDTISKIPGNKELIISDGGSTDKTIQRVNRYSASFKLKLISSEKGRANQMNRGAEFAEGDILWFLHSDSKVNKSSINEMEKAIEQGYDGGCFSLYFYDFSSFSLKWIAWTSNLRAKYLKLIFGDQSMFMKKELFDRIGGFKNIPIMEDWEMSKSMYEKGKIKVLDCRIGTSARRFVDGGAIRTLLKMHKIKYMYLKGKQPSEIIEYYKDIR